MILLVMIIMQYLNRIYFLNISIYIYIYYVNNQIDIIYTINNVIFKINRDIKLNYMRINVLAMFLNI